VSGRCLGFIVSLTLLAPIHLAGQEGSVQGQAKFRSSVDLVSVTAIVRDRKGRFVRDLAQKDFTVEEAGRQRRILDFRSESDGPIRLAFLFDVSGSMRVGSKAVDARQAARQLLSSLRPTDQAGLFMFDTRLERVKDFSSDFAALDAAFDHVDPPYGQTSLYDAVAGTAQALVDASGGTGKLQQRSAVVVFTDGIDTRSRLTPEQVSAVASGIDVPVYVIAVVAPIDDPRQSGRPDDEGGLRNLSQWTGGELFTASAPAHASVATRQIVEELRHQYVLAFEASTGAGWRPLEVRARDRALIVRARTGYSAGGQTVAEKISGKER
jgi:VWFA-related protein